MKPATPREEWERNLRAGSYLERKEHRRTNKRLTTVGVTMVALWLALFWLVGESMGWRWLP